MCLFCTSRKNLLIMGQSKAQGQVVRSLPSHGTVSRFWAQDLGCGMCPVRGISERLVQLSSQPFFREEIVIFGV